MSLPALPAASLRHLLRHPAQLALALLGLALGVATIVAVDTATASAQRAFELSLQAVNGAADYQIVGGPAGIDERLYVQLRRSGPPGAAPLRFAPLVSGYVQLGGRILQLIGTDPFAGAELEADPGESRAPGGGAPAADAAAARGWLAPGAVALGASLAAALHLAPGDSLELTVGGVGHRATVARILPGAAFDTLILTDIAQAQEWLGVLGRLSRIDLRLPPGAPGARALEGLRRTLPAGLELQATRATARETFAMTGAFTTNLKAMSLLALLVGTLLIYGAVSFAVVQRRAIFGVLRALGATGGQVLILVLAEAAVLGVAGAACGALLGLLLARSLVGLVAQTINDLYFVVAVSNVSVPALTLVKALGAGVATALVAALLPALEVARAAPQLALARSSLEQRALGIARRLAVASAALALAAGLLVLVSGRSLLAGFVALFLLLIAVAAATPAALRALALGSARVAARSAVARLACGEIAGSLSRTGVAVASLGMALTAMIGVAIMVGSFRESLREWLLETLRADIYVSAPGSADSPERRLAPELIGDLLATPGVRAHSEGRRAVVRSPRGPLDLNALSIPPASRGAFRFSAGDPARAWQAFAAGAVLISEPLAWRLALAPHDTLTLTTSAGPRAFEVAGVYREYGNDRGELLMSLAEYRRSFGDDGVGALGLYLAPGTAVAQTVAALRRTAAGRQALLIRSNAELRALSMRIFERTFLITRVLYWLAAGVAAVGLVSALLAWELERGAQLALLRALGLTPARTALLVLAQTAFMGLAALLAALPAGLLTALVLTEVINRRAFGWRIDLHLSAGQFTNALWLALAASLAAGLYPAWRGARLAPAAALREA